MCTRWKNLSVYFSFFASSLSLACFALVCRDRGVTSAVKIVVDIHPALQVMLVIQGLDSNSPIPQSFFPADVICYHILLPWFGSSLNIQSKLPATDCTRARRGLRSEDTAEWSLIDGASDHKPYNYHADRRDLSQRIALSSQMLRMATALAWPFKACMGAVLKTRWPVHFRRIRPIAPIPRTYSSAKELARCSSGVRRYGHNDTCAVYEM